MLVSQSKNKSTTPLEFYPEEGKVGRWLPSTLNYSSQVVFKGAEDLPPKWGTAVCGETLLCKNRSGGPLSSPSAAKAVAAEIKRPADAQFEMSDTVSESDIHIVVVTDVVLPGHEEESE